MPRTPASRPTASSRPERWPGGKSIWLPKDKLGPEWLKEFKPTAFGFDGYTRGVRPADHAIK